MDAPAPIDPPGSTPSTTTTFTCNLCEALCGLELTVEGQGAAARVTRVRGDDDDVFSRGHICPKAPALVELLEDPDRLRQPVRRTATGWQPVSWEAALDEAVARLRAVRAEHGKDAVALYVGNPAVHGHRATLGAQLLTSALGSKNRYDANSQDSNPKIFACMQVYGDGLSLTVPDVDRTDLLVILGGNPAASGGSIMSLGDVRGRLGAIAKRGGRVVLFDPRRSETAAQFATEHHFIAPGSDAAFLLALLHVVFAERLVDEEALERVASGVATLRAIAARFSPERVQSATGIAPAVTRELGRALARTPRAVVYGRIGICQNEFGPVASWLVEALNVVCGHVDVEGGAMFAEPAADIGPIARFAVGNHYARYRSRVRGLPEFLGAFPSAVLAEEMETPGPGRIRAFISFAGNPVSSVPNGERVGRALPDLDFVLAIDPYINETSRHAHLILPPAHVLRTGNFDLLLQTLTVRNVVKYSPPALPRLDGERDDFEILAELAARVALPAGGLVDRIVTRQVRKRAGALPDQIIDLLLRTGPHRTRGLTVGKLRAMPHGVDLGPLYPMGTKRLRTDDGRACLAPEPCVADVPRLERWLERERAPLVLIGRRHLRSNNSWMHNLRSLTRGPDRARLLMHPADASERGLVDGARVRVRTRVGEVQSILSVTDDVMRGVVSLPHGFGQSVVKDTLRVAGALEAPSANALTDDEFVEPVLGTSVLNGIAVEVRAVGNGPPSNA